MQDTRQIMKPSGLGESPTTPQSPSSKQERRPIAPSFPLSNSYLKLPSPIASTDSRDTDYHRPTALVAPVSASIPPFQTPKAQPILFYDKNDAFYEFTNFSPHHVIYKGKRYPTSEHLFQTFKFLDDYPEIAERIRNCGERPMLAFDEVHRYRKWVRSDWRRVNIQKMETALYCKFTQHPNLKASLLGTGDADLIENSPRDYFWGIGADQSGRNELGKALVRLREGLRQEESTSSHIPTARRDTTPLSVRDLTSFVPTQPPSNVNPQSPFVVPTAGNGLASPKMVSPQGSGLCEFCRTRPKFRNHLYCSRTCAVDAVEMCSFCRRKPRFWKDLYCSNTCAAQAGGFV